MPRPRNAERYSPLSTFSTAWRTRHSSWRSMASGDWVGAGVEGSTAIPDRELPRASARGRHRRALDDLRDDLIRRDFLRLGFVRQAQAVAHHIRRELLHKGGGE